MKIQIQGVPTFFFHLTIEEVDALIKLALAHYDFRCKRTAGPDGILQLWKKDLRVAQDIRASQGEGEEPYNPALRAKWDDLDTIAKICEPENMLGFPAHLREVASKVYMAFMVAMNASNEKYKAWQHEIESGH